MEMSGLLIKIDKSEFSFQLHSHPDFPSLLSIVDTLSFFEIPNKIFHCDFSKINELPQSYIAVLKTPTGNSTPYYVKKKNGKFQITNGKETNFFTSTDIKSLWMDVVFVIEKTSVKKKNKINFDYWAVSALLVGYGFFVWSYFAPVYVMVYFFLLPVFGFFLSIYSKKNLFKLKFKYLDKLCEGNKAISCDQIIRSDNNRPIKLGDLSILYFLCQLILPLIIMSMGNYMSSVLVVLFVLGISSIPFILYSIYYQKIIEKNGVLFA